MIKFLKRSKPECQQLANPALRVLMPTRLLAKIDKTTLKIELTATAARPPKTPKSHDPDRKSGDLSLKRPGNFEVFQEFLIPGQSIRSASMAESIAR